MWHLFPVLVRGDRDALRSHLADRGVQSAVHYPIPIPSQSAMEGKARIVGTIDRARSFCAQEVSLPIHPLMTPGDVDQVIAACVEWRG